MINVYCSCLKKELGYMNMTNEVIIIRWLISYDFTPYSRLCDEKGGDHL